MTDLWNLLPASSWPVQRFIPPDEQARILQSALSLGIPLDWSALSATAPGLAARPLEKPFGNVTPTSGNVDAIQADNPDAQSPGSVVPPNAPELGLPNSGLDDGKRLLSSAVGSDEAGQRLSLDAAYGNPNIARQGQRGRAVAAPRPPAPEAISDIGPEIYRAGGEALHDINAGLNPFSAERRALYQQSADAATPDEALTAHWESKKLLGRGLLGVPELFAAPFTGLWRSVAGHSLQSATAGLRAAAVGVLGEDAVRRGEQAAGAGPEMSFEEARQTADSLMPAIAPRAGMPRGPLPRFPPELAPPLVPEIPFGPDPVRSGQRVAGAGAHAPGAEQALTSYVLHPDLDNELRALEKRAHEIHNALTHDIERRQRTTAVLSTNEGWIVAGGTRDLTPLQLRLLGQNEHPAKLRGADAEITALREADRRGWTPRAIVATRKICPDCEGFIKSRGGRVMPNLTTAIFPARGVSP